MGRASRALICLNDHGWGGVQVRPCCEKSASSLSITSIGSQSALSSRASQSLRLDVDHGERRLAWLCLARLGHFVSEQPQQYLIARLIAGRVSFGDIDELAIPLDVFVTDKI